jgi:hypothetical protein
MVDMERISHGDGVARFFQSFCCGAMIPREEGSGRIRVGKGIAART